MARIAKVDKERRFSEIRKLVKRYHKPKSKLTLPEVKNKVALELNCSIGTVNNALKN